MLATLRAFAGDFETIKISPDGTIEVKSRTPEAKPIVARGKPKKGDEAARTLTAIDSLSMKAPPFEGWGH